jgi:O-antigen ligase
MSGRHRIRVAGLILLGVLAAVLLVVFAGNACPAETDAQPCPDATRNLVIGIALASAAVGLLVAPFAFLAEVLARRRIVYRGAWARAGRRGALAGLIVAGLAGLRLGGALNVPTALFVLILAGVIEWYLARSDA